MGAISSSAMLSCAHHITIPREEYTTAYGQKNRLHADCKVNVWIAWGEEARECANAMELSYSKAVPFASVACLPEAHDNCAIARCIIEQGTEISLDTGATFVLTHRVLEGHRFAARVRRVEHRRCLVLHLARRLEEPEVARGGGAA